MPNFIKNLPIPIVLLVVFILQFPFLQADPDIDISRSRGPFTDEGLYTLQVRNFLNHHGFDVNESGSFVKTPFYNVVMLLGLALFGTNLLAARSLILLFSLLTLFYIGTKSKWRFLTIVLIAITFTQFHVFHFSHYCVPEMMAIAFLLLAIYFSYLYFVGKQLKGETIFSRHKQLLLAVLFAFFAWFTKIQFVYFAAVLPAFSVIWFLLNPNIRNLKAIAWTIGFTIGFALLYLLFWYLPLKDTFDYVMFDQTTDRFPPPDIFWNIVEENYHKVFLSRYLMSFTFAFYIAAAAGLVLLFFTRSRSYRFLFIITMVWILFELHKVAIWWLPSRYIISLLVAAGLLISIVGTELLRLLFAHSQKKVSLAFSVIKVLLILILCTAILGLSTWNLSNYQKSLSRRQFAISTINDYLVLHQDNSRSIIGGWAASFNWKNKAHSIPIWKGYLNDQNILERDPAIIISEPDQQDSGGAYEKSGINLDASADSMRVFKVGRWDLCIYWLGK